MVRLFEALSMDWGNKHLLLSYGYLQFDRGFMVSLVGNTFLQWALYMFYLPSSHQQTQM